MKKRFALILVSSGIIFATAFGATSANWAVSDSADNFGIKITVAPPAGKHNVKFYTTFDGSVWGGETTLSVDEGSTVVAPTVTKTGYTLKGWTNIQPSLSVYAPDYNTTEINKLAIDQDYTFYPIIESNNDKVWINGSGFVGDVNSDITINQQKINQVIIGKDYVGVTNGVCNPVVDDKTQKDLNSGSGIYQFSASGSSLVISRKISVNTSNITSSSDVHYNWLDANAKTDIYAFGSGEKWYADVAGNTNTGTAYVDYKYTSFIIVRRDPSKSVGWSGKWDQTVDISLTNKDKGSEVYSKDHITIWVEAARNDGNLRYSFW